MLEIKIEKSFKKDIIRDKKSGLYSGKDFEILKAVVSSLLNNEELDKKYKRHPLKGDMKNFESVHIKNDWMLIFKVDKKYLYLLMLGKHTQVYKKFK